MHTEGRERMKVSQAWLAGWLVNFKFCPADRSDQVKAVDVVAPGLFVVVFKKLWPLKETITIYTLFIPAGN